VALAAPGSLGLAGHMPLLVSRYVRTGKLKVVFRPLTFNGPDSVRGRNAVVAAGRQGRLFDVRELLYRNQGTEKPAGSTTALSGASALPFPVSTSRGWSARAAPQPWRRQAPPR
jgi:Thioredoxin